MEETNYWLIGGLILIMLLITWFLWVNKVPPDQNGHGGKNKSAS